MLPVSGPVTTTVGINANGVVSWRERVMRYRQSKPYDLPLPYLRERARTLSYFHKDPLSNTGMGNAWTTKFPQGYAHTKSFPVDAITDAVTRTVDAARSKFIGELGPASEMLVNLAERRQALEMIAKRSLQLLRFSNAIRKGRFKEAARILGVTRDKRYLSLSKGKRLRREAKAFSSNWLEFHFGWSPLIHDIGSAVDLLQSPVPKALVRGKRTTFDTWSYTQTGSSYQLYALHTYKINALVQAEVQVENTNLWLANRLGLINPATVAWDLVPFSFVVDWFIPVSDFLGQFTEFSGLKVQNAFYTTRVIDTASYTDRGGPTGGSWSLYESVSSCSMVTERILGIPSVSLQTRAPWRLSPTRALTAITLLIQVGFKR